MTDIDDIAAESFRLADEKLRRLVTGHPGATPTFTRQGKWVVEDDPWAPNWSAGFVTGQMLILADRLDSEFWRQRGLEYAHNLAARRFDTSTHDIGFLFTPSWGRLRSRDDTAEARQMIVDAGRTMARRFNRNGRYLSSWVDPGSTFIDIMMNLDIIWEAAEISGDDQLVEIARQHAMTSRKYLVRGDGSTLHEGWFDPESGVFLRADTHQGWRPDSTWSRGQAWAIYGFGQAYLRTHDDRLLRTAEDVAQAYIERVLDEVPPNDLDEPHPRLPHEASAGAVAAAGLAQLATITAGSSSRQYHETAKGIVRKLSRPPYLSIDEPDWDGLIRCATYHFNNGVGVNESVAWGDYYYLEALNRLTRS